MRLSVDNLKGGYGSNKVLDGISFEAVNGDMIYVLGANGCGKTTLLNMLIGYKSFDSGKISFDSAAIKELSISQRAKYISYIPQIHVPAFAFNVLDVVVMGRAGMLAFFDKPKKQDYDLAYEALKILGIEDFAQKDYTQLSGGERQLVLIARAICQGAEMILMDEPMQSLDFVNQSMVQRAAKMLARQGHIVIMSTHTAINNYEDSDKVLLMSRNGTAVFGPIEETMTQQNAQEAYGTHLEVMYSKDKTGGRHINCLPTGV